MRSMLSARRQLAAATALSLSSVLLLAASSAAISIDWVTVGDPGNACDDQPQGCFGDVAYVYQIAKYEVTNAQYAEFLNAVADTDANALYNTNMGTSVYGGITRSGDAGSFSYDVIAERGNLPVTYVSSYDALRFANWLQNGQPDTGAQTIGTTEGGSYTFLNATTASARNPLATIFLTSEREWYKAAYYDALSLSYFDYPAGANALPGCAAPSATPNTANCNFAAPGFALTDVGSYLGSASPYGTLDQGGNVSEWNEALVGGFPTTLPTTRVLRGGSFVKGASYTGASSRDGIDPSADQLDIGFRLVNVVPEPGTGLLVMAGMLGLAGWRRRR